MSELVHKVKTYQKRDSIKGILQDKKKKIRLYFLISGILFIWLGFSISGGFSSFQKNPTLKSAAYSDVKSFSQEPVKVDNSLLQYKASLSKEKLPPTRIIIPALDIDIPVKQAKIIKGYWEVPTDSAGFGLGSSYPEENGNQIIFAHARKGLFLPLQNAKQGQMVYVMTNIMWYAYKIEEIKEVLPSQTEVIAPTSESVLTLYTCTGFADSKRLIVKAKRV